MQTLLLSTQSTNTNARLDVQLILHHGQQKSCSNIQQACLQGQKKKRRKKKKVMVSISNTLTRAKHKTVQNRTENYVTDSGVARHLLESVTRRSRTRPRILSCLRTRIVFPIRAVAVVVTVVTHSTARGRCGRFWGPLAPRAFAVQSMHSRRAVSIGHNHDILSRVKCARPNRCAWSSPILLLLCFVIPTRDFHTQLARAHSLASTGCGGFVRVGVARSA